MKSVLVIAYFFPPLGGGGVQRTLGFVRHLPSFGYQPVVLAAAPSVAYWAMDESLLADVPSDVEVHRVEDGLWAKGVGIVRRAVPASKRPRFDAWWLLPDRQAPWLAPALRRARALAKARTFDLVYSTGQPWTDHLVAGALVSRSHTPWVADFRDPWTQNQQYRAATRLHDTVQHRLEAAVYDRAQRIVVNTKHNERELHRAFPRTQGRTVYIPNGFDGARLEALARSAPSPSSGELIISYAGSLYPGYGAEAFFRVVAGALDLVPALRARLRLRFVGKTNVRADAERFGLGDRLMELGYLARDEVDRVLLSGHVSLAVLPPHDGHSGWVPQKLYTYLALGRPVLALFPEGDAADILRLAGGEHLILDPARPDARRLAEWLQRLAEPGHQATSFDPEVVGRFEREALTAKLAACFDELTRGTAAS